MRRLVRIVLLAGLGIIASAAFGQTPGTTLWRMDGWTSANTSFSRDGSSILVWNASGFAVYGAASGNLRAYVGTVSQVSGACLAKNGATVYYACNNALVIYNVAGQTQSYPSIGFTGTNPQDFCVSEDGSTLGFTTAVSSSQTNANLVTLSNTALKASFPIKPASGQPPSSMNFTDAGNQVVFDGPTLYTIGGTKVGSIANTSPVAVSPDEQTFYCEANTANYGLAAYSASNLGLKWSAGVTGEYRAPAPSADGTVVYVALSAPGHWYVQGYASATGRELPDVFDLPLALGPNPALAASPVNPNVVLGPGSLGPFAGVVDMVEGTGTGNYLGTLFSNSSSGTAQAVQSGVQSEFVVGPQIFDAQTGTATTALPYSPIPVSPDAADYLGLGENGSVTVYSVANEAALASYTPAYNHYTLNAGWGASSGQLWIVDYNATSPTYSLLLYAFNGSKLTLSATAILDGDPLLVTYSADGTHAAELESTAKRVFVYSATTGTQTGSFTASTNSNGISRIDAGPGSLIGVSETLTGAVNQYRVFNVSSSATLVNSVSYSLPSGSRNAEGTISPDGRYIVMDDLVSQAAPETRLLPHVRIYRASDGQMLQEWQAVPAQGANASVHLCVSTDSSVAILQAGAALVAFGLPPTKMSLSLNLSSVLGGGSATGTISFDSPVPEATTIKLTSTSKAASVPSSVVIAAGASSATFAVSTSGVDASTAVTVNSVDALNSILEASSSLTVTPATAISFTLSPATVVGGSPSTGTITLNALAGPSGVRVGLSSSSAFATVPSSVTVPSGSTFATFNVSTTNPTATTSATIKAGAGSLLSSATLKVTPIPSVVLTFGSSAVVGGTAASLTVTLSSPAPAGGSTYSLSASKTALQPPASITVPAGQTSVTVGIPSVPVASNTPVSLSAGQKGSTLASASITVDAPVVSGVTPSGTEFVGPTTALALVVLDGPAPASFSVSASSSSSVVSLPKTISIPSGQTYMLVTLTIAAVKSVTPVTITIGGISCTVTVLP